MTLTLQAPMTIQTQGTNLIMTWPGVLGQTYQLEYKDELTDPSWIPLGAAIVGADGTITITNDVGASPKRYFRLVIP